MSMAGGCAGSTLDATARGAKDIWAYKSSVDFGELRDLLTSNLSNVTKRHKMAIPRPRTYKEMTT